MVKTVSFVFCRFYWQQEKLFLHGCGVQRSDSFGYLSAYYEITWVSILLPPPTLHGSSGTIFWS